MSAAGMSFPFRIDKENGGIAFQSDNANKLKENITQILITGIGERLMRRDYGGGVQQLLHDPNNEVLRSIMQHQISKAIIQHEPRIILQSVIVKQIEGELFAEVNYRLRQNQVAQNLRVPIGLGGI